MKLKSNYLAVLSVIFLAACGGGSSGDSANSVNTEAAQDISISTSQISIQKAFFNQQKTVTVPAQADQAVKISSVTARAGDSCRVVGYDGLSYTFEASNFAEECQFNYELSPESAQYSGRATGKTRVAVSETAEDVALNIISKAIYSDGSFIIIDLKSELGASWPGDDYHLDEDSYEISNESLFNTYSFSDESKFFIQSKSQSSGGVANISYSLTNGLNTKLGLITISVSNSDGVNRKPQAKDHFVPESESNKYKVGGDPVPFNLKDLGLVSDPDGGDTLSLVEVLDSDVIASIVSAKDMKIEVDIIRTGAHAIAYTVSDGKGGFDSGFIYFTVPADVVTGVKQDWNSVTVYDSTIATNITFSAPLSQAVADFMLAPYNETYSDSSVAGDEDAVVVLNTYQQAVNYCSMIGARLPIEREIKLLMARSSLYTSTDNQWPLQKRFWIADKTNASTAKIYDLASKFSSTSDISNANYTTCVLLNDEKIKNFTAKIDYTASPTTDSTAPDNRLTMSIVVKDPDGKAASYQTVELASTYGQLGLMEGTSKQSSISLPMSRSGGAQFYYYHDYRSDSILVKMGINIIGYYTYQYGIANISYVRNLEIYQDSLWNRSGTIAGIDNIRGLNIWKSSSSYRSVNLLKEEFTGSSFSGLVVFNQDDNNDTQAASFSFGIQQRGAPTLISSSPDTGILNDGKEIIINVVRNSSLTLTLHDGNGSRSLASLSSAYNIKGYREYYWFDFDYSSQQLHFYFNSNPTKPNSPTTTIYNVDTGNIDFSQPYRVQIGANTGSGGSRRKAYISTIRFGAWN